MKHLLFTLAFLCTYAVAHADPWDCMSKTEAEELLAWIKKNPFIIDYCDCCHDLELESDGHTDVKAVLLHITNAEIVPCEYDPERVSIRVKYFVMSESTVDKKGELKNTDQNNPKFDNPNLLLTLNYHFVTADNTNLRLFEAMRWLKYEHINCSGLVGYPNPGEFTDAVGKKYQKWSTKQMNHWE